MRLALFAALFIAACGADGAARDGGAGDGGARDGGATDAGAMSDAQFADASDDASLDSGARDAGPAGACDPLVMPTPNEDLSEAPGVGGCPSGMVALSTVCMDQYEAALVLVDDSGPIGSWSPFHNPGSNRVGAVSLAGAVPQGYISGTQSAAACAESGKRLCTDTEWLFA